MRTSRLRNMSPVGTAWPTSRARNRKTTCVCDPS
ncbi:MAG: hypothetical protein AB7S26_04175 [Sandaracinaceae bacterium]